MTDTKRTSETSVHFNETTRRYILGDYNLKRDVVHLTRTDVFLISLQVLTPYILHELTP
jgi:hypothetical protein